MTETEVDAKVLVITAVVILILILLEMQVITALNLMFPEVTSLMAVVQVPMDFLVLVLTMVALLARTDIMRMQDIQATITK